MRFREVSRRTADQLGLDSPTVEYIVEGWLRVAMRLLADGHTIPTPLGTIRTKRADARLRRSRGYRRDLKIVTSREARASIDQLRPTRRPLKVRPARGAQHLVPPRFSPPRFGMPSVGS
jgi:hypothetical protein